MVTFFLAVGLLALFFAMMSVRLIFLKKGEFKGTCATQSPFLRQQGIRCACGKVPGSCEPSEETDRSLPAIGSVTAGKSA